MKVSKKSLFVVGGLAAGAVVLIGSTAIAAKPFGALPGWGFGDKNHIHVGPPGASVRIDQDGDNSVIHAGGPGNPVTVESGPDGLTGVQVGDQKFEF